MLGILPTASLVFERVGSYEACLDFLKAPSCERECKVEEHIIGFARSRF